MAIPTLRPVPRSTVVDAVTEQIRSEILAGTLAPGARLPPERELAEQFGINRLTLRAALGRLEELGLIATQHGSGSIVCGYREHGGLEMLPPLIRVMREREPATFAAMFRDVLDLRRTVACEAIAFAAERHTADDLDAIRAAIDAQASRVGDAEAFARGDLEFARLVVRATRNVALELLLNSIVRLPLEDPVLLRVMYPSPRAQNRHYGTIVALLETRDGKLARDVMRSALEVIDRITLARLQRTLAKGPNATHGRDR